MAEISVGSHRPPKGPSSQESGRTRPRAGRAASEDGRTQAGRAREGPFDFSALTSASSYSASRRPAQNNRPEALSLCQNQTRIKTFPEPVSKVECPSQKPILGFLKARLCFWVCNRDSRAYVKRCPCRLFPVPSLVPRIVFSESFRCCLPGTGFAVCCALFLKRFPSFEFAKYFCFLARRGAA